MKITMDSPMQLIYSPNYRVFKLFGHLPPELRRFIWALSLDTPGIHFLRLASKGSWKFLGIDNNTSLTNSQTYITPNGKRVCFDEIATEVAREKAPRSVRDMQLVSSTPWRSDVSYHRVTQRRLAVLSATCTESRSVADFMRSRKSALRLDNGLVVSLEGSNDVIFLEYMPRMYESTGINYTLRPYVPLLQGIRRLAVRFYHEWNTKTSERPCDNCREFHIAEADAVTPVHLYQFMARCLPSLTEFYFVDYFMPRKGNWPANAVSDQESNYPICKSIRVYMGSFSFSCSFVLISWQPLILKSFTGLTELSSKPTTTTGSSSQRLQRLSTGSRTDSFATPRRADSVATMPQKKSPFGSWDVSGASSLRQCTGPLPR